MKKQLFAIFLCFALLTGCTADTPSETDIINDVISMPPATAVATPQAADTAAIICIEPTDTNTDTYIFEYVPPEMKGEITISVLEESEFLTTAADMFMNKYTDIKVNINYFRRGQEIVNADGTVMSAAPGEEFAAERYVSQLNTKIMSGQAEDIIFTPPIPAYKYADIGAFVDLAPYMKSTAEINADNYFMNIFEVMKDEQGRLFELPLSAALGQIFYVSKKMADETGIYLPEDISDMSFSQILDYALQLTEASSKPNRFLTNGDGRDIAYNMIRNDCLPRYNVDFKNKKAFFDTGEYEALLNRVQDMQSKYYFMDEETRKKLISYALTDIAFAYGYDFSIQAAYYALAAKNEAASKNDPVYYAPASDSNGNVYLGYTNSYAINSKSKNIGLAWEFLKFMISDEVMSLPAFFHIPVNITGFDAQVDVWLRMYNYVPVDRNEYRALLEQWVRRINAYTPTDPTIERLIYEENQKFFNKEQTAAETARNLQSKLNKYMNE